MSVREVLVMLMRHVKTEMVHSDATVNLVSLGMVIHVKVIVDKQQLS